MIFNNVTIKMHNQNLLARDDLECNNIHDKNEKYTYKYIQVR